MDRQVGVLGEVATCCHHLGLDGGSPGELRPHLTLREERLMLGTRGQWYLFCLYVYS